MRFRKVRARALQTSLEKRKPPTRLPLPRLLASTARSRIRVLLRAIRLGVASRVRRFGGVDEVVVGVVVGRAEIDVFEVG